MSATPSAYPAAPQYLASKVPPREARLRGPVGAPVRVRWDAWGVPHLRAETLDDLCFALGYVTAQEHLWRLELSRRQARGELAALVGRDALAADRLLRTLGIGRHADALADGQLGAAEASALAAYAAGVNQWLERAVAERRLPVELDWLGVTPQPWRPADCIAIWKYRWWTLTGRLENIVLAEAARRHLPPALLEAFMAVELGEETILPGTGGRTVPGGADDGTGSNNWAVAGGRTTTGYPVLCSDPHNPFTQPAQWYDAQLTLAGGSLDVAGATYIGWPGVYIGRNRHMAWGFTNHVAPIRDLYVESPSAVTGVAHERIEVRDAPAETLEIRRTPRGPIVNAFVPQLEGDDAPLSLRWTGTEVGSGFDAMLALNAATSAAGAVAALEHWPCTVLNLLAADDQGHLAYHVTGWVPRRRRAARGYRRGDDPADAWDGYLPYDQLPQIMDPPRGWLASANQPPWQQDPPGMAYVAGGAWADGGRMRRIRQRLTAQERMTPEQIGSVQADVTSVRALELKDALVRALQPDAPAEVRPALEALAAWDGRYTVDSIAPTIWTAFWDAWLLQVAAARLPGPAATPAAGQAGSVARRLILGEDTNPPWFPTGSGGAGSGIAGHLLAALQAARQHVAERFGAQTSGWRWGAVHTVTWRHALATQGPAALREAAAAVLDVGPFPTSGGPTVRAAGASAAQPYTVTGGATYRLVADLSPGGGMVVTSTTGQSGHPGSPHYADQAPYWLEDRYRPLALDDFQAAAETEIVP